MKQLDAADKEVALRLYLILAALFIASLVTCNLIFRKFFSIDLFSGTDWQFTLEQSVGLLPYPITFLLTDMISETFGRKKANMVVVAGLISSLLVLSIIWISDLPGHAEWSPVTSGEFTHVFGQTFIAVGSSMCAYLIAQFIDIRIFHYWKTLTKGKKLWLRNNFSTILSQFVDTLVVLLLLCSASEIPWSQFTRLLAMGFLFKVIVALLDTPLFYLLNFWVRKRFNLQLGEEISLT